MQFGIMISFLQIKQVVGALTFLPYLCKMVRSFTASNPIIGNCNLASWTQLSNGTVATLVTTSLYLTSEMYALPTSVLESFTSAILGKCLRITIIEYCTLRESRSG